MEIMNGKSASRTGRTGSGGIVGYKKVFCKKRGKYRGTIRNAPVRPVRPPNAAPPVPIKPQKSATRGGTNQSPRHLATGPAGDQ